MIEAFLFRRGDIVWVSHSVWSGYAVINDLLDSKPFPRYSTDSCDEHGNVSPVSLRQEIDRQVMEADSRLHRPAGYRTSSF